MCDNDSIKKRGKTNASTTRKKNKPIPAEKRILCGEDA